MSATEDFKSSSCRDYGQHEATLPGQQLAWIRSLRGDALEQFKTHGLPLGGDEAWKYTDLKALNRRTFEVAAQAPAIEPQQARTQSLIEAPCARLVFVDGLFARALSSASLPMGVSVASLAETLQTDAAALEGRLGQQVEIAQPGFSALNTALMADGAYICVHRDTPVSEPIELLFLSSGSPDRAAHVRNLFVLESGASAVVVENHAALGDGAYFTDIVSEIFVDEHASLQHYKVQRDGVQAFHFAGTHIRQHRNGHYVAHTVDLGGRLVRNTVSASLAGEGAECTLNGLYVASGRQHVDHHTRIDHLVPHAISREQYKGVLDGRARGIFSGRVVVHPHAQQSDAQQAHDSLLLSDDAEADSRPQLEIYADDVKCSHGSTVGQLDDDALFYLRARGIGLEHGRELLVRAFAAGVVAQMQFEPLRARLDQLVGEKLAAANLSGTR